MSSSITKGDAWFGRITTELEQAKVGVVFITPENQREEWLNFESGAMLTRVGEQLLCPVLIGLPDLEYKGPLKNLQLTTFEDKEEMRKLILDIHELSDSTVTKDVINDAFDDRWVRFLAAATEGMDSHNIDPVPAELERGIDDKLDEALGMLRGLTRESRRSPSPGRKDQRSRSAWRFVQRYKDGEVSRSEFLKSDDNLRKDLYEQMVSLDDGSIGRIIHVQVIDDEMIATVETKIGSNQGIMRPLVSLVHSAAAFEATINLSAIGSMPD